MFFLKYSQIMLKIYPKFLKNSSTGFRKFHKFYSKFVYNFHETFFHSSIILLRTWSNSAENLLEGFKIFP